MGRWPKLATFRSRTRFHLRDLGEELGLIGATAIVVCFCIIAIRGVRARCTRRTGTAPAGHRPDRHDCRAGVRQHQCGPWARADQGQPVAVRSYGGSSMIAS